jgi:hypothetical protein
LIKKKKVPVSFATARAIMVVMVVVSGNGSRRGDMAAAMSILRTKRR